MNKEIKSIIIETKNVDLKEYYENIRSEFLNGDDFAGEKMSNSQLIDCVRFLQSENETLKFNKIKADEYQEFENEKRDIATSLIEIKRKLINEVSDVVDEVNELLNLVD